MTLTDASVKARKIIKYGVGIISFIVLARLTFLSGVNLYEKLFPDPPPKPTVKFGKLPEINFGEGESAEGLSYVLETVSGGLPVFQEQTPVYLITQPLPGIRALDNARDTARQLGFSSEGRELVETVYLFSKGGSPSTLNMNIVTGIFSISYDINSDPQVFDQIPPSAEAAASSIKNMLNNANLLGDLQKGPVSHKYLRVEAGQLVEAISLSEANIVKVNLYREAYGPGEAKLPSVTQDPNESNVWFMLTGSGGNQKIIAGEYHHFPIDPAKVATYPVKTAQQAWNNLQEGKAYIASLGENDDNKITIKNVYLEYFDPAQYDQFYQPVAVFEGENGFVAYVPAVTNEFYGGSN